MDESASTLPGNNNKDTAAVAGSGTMPSFSTSSSSAASANNAADDTPGNTTSRITSTIPVTASTTRGTPLTASTTRMLGTPHQLEYREDDEEKDDEQEKEPDGIGFDLLTDKERASLQVLNMLTEHDGEHQVTRMEREKMLAICRNEIRLSDNVISLYLGKMKNWGTIWVNAEDIDTRMSMEQADDGAAVQQPPISRRNNMKKVDRDLSRLIEAARVGDLSIKSWFIDVPSKWRITKLPPINKVKRDIFRAEFLHRVSPFGHVTMMHNSLVSFHLPSAHAYRFDWCVGYHCHTTAWDSYETGYSAFCGNELQLGVNSIIKAIHNMQDDINKPTDVNVDHAHFPMSQMGDPTNPPSKDIRASNPYRSLFPDREVLPSIDELKQRIGPERFERFLQFCRDDFIFPDGDDVERYLEDHQGCHMIMPALWLCWQSVCSNPHLFHILDVKLKTFLEKGKGDNDCGDDEEDGEEECEEDDAIEGGGSEGKKELSYPRVYEDIRAAHADDLDHSARVVAMEKYLNDGVMKMLKGEIQGALKDKESRDNVFLNANFWRAQKSQLTRQDRSRYYRPNATSEHGRFMNVLAVTNGYMRKGGGVALGGCHNTQGHDFLIRVKFAVAMFKSHLIEYGGDDYPITKMNCIITMNNYRRSPLEVHRFEFHKPHHSYDDRYHSAVQKLEEENKTKAAEKMSKLNGWSNWGNSSDDSSYSDEADEDDDGLDFYDGDVLTKEEDRQLDLLTRLGMLTTRLGPDKLEECCIEFEEQLKEKNILEYTRYSLRHNGPCRGRVKRSGGSGGEFSSQEVNFFLDREEENNGSEEENSEISRPMSTSSDEASDSDSSEKIDIGFVNTGGSNSDSDISRPMSKRSRCASSSDEARSDSSRCEVLGSKRSRCASSSDETSGSSSSSELVGSKRSRSASSSDEHEYIVERIAF